MLLRTVFFVCSSDVALLVRQNSVHVWKVVVTTTARTLREILPTLISLLLGSLASSSYDRRYVTLHAKLPLLFLLLLLLFLLPTLADKLQPGPWGIWYVS